jgi:hypothetical protein
LRIGCGPVTASAVWRGSCNRRRFRLRCDRRRRFSSPSRFLPGLGGSVFALWSGSAERILSLRFIGEMSGASNPDRYTTAPSRRRVIPWVLLLVLVAVGGAVFWGNNRSEKDSSRTTTVQSEAAQPSPTPQDDTKQAVTALQQAVKDLQSASQRAADQITDLQRQLSAEEGERKLLADQVDALSARLDNLGKARAEIRAPRSRGAR